MTSAHARNRQLAASLRRQTRRTAEREPALRGASWRLALVTATATDGTVAADGISGIRRLESYANPAVGDLIVISLSANGNWLALGRTATGDDPIGGIRVARKTADTARTSTTQAADPHLSFPVQAGATYLLDGWIKYDADAAADIALDWTAPSNSLGEWTGSGASIDTTGAANGYSVQLAATDIESARSYGGAGVGANLTVDIKGTLRVGATAGTYQLTWAQRVSSATATTVYTDSWLRLHRVA